MLMMADGRAQAFGPKDEVLKRVLRPASVPVEARPADTQAAPGALQASA